MEIKSESLGRILYADDDKGWRDSISELLRREGYECVTATDGLEGAQKLREGRFDCLISEIRMLGNVNLELIHSVAKNQPGLPVILVTGHPSVATATESLKLPVVSYLVKPIDFGALREAVHDAMIRSLLIRQFEIARVNQQSWFAELRQITDGLKSAPRLPIAGPRDTYMMITFRNIMEALLGLKGVMEHSFSSQPQANGAAIGGRSPLLLIDALRDTIAVLEKSKDSFRSRDLGDLRKKLEQLLDTEKHHPNAQ